MKGYALYSHKAKRAIIVHDYNMAKEMCSTSDYAGMRGGENVTLETLLEDCEYMNTAFKDAVIDKNGYIIV